MKGQLKILDQKDIIELIGGVFPHCTFINSRPENIISLSIMEIWMHIKNKNAKMNGVIHLIENVLMRLNSKKQTCIFNVTHRIEYSWYPDYIQFFMVCRVKCRSYYGQTASDKILCFDQLAMMKIDRNITMEKFIDAMNGFVGLLPQIINNPSMMNNGTIQYNPE